MQLLNAFSLNMVQVPLGTVQFSEISLDEARAILADRFESAVGHPDTAAVFSDVLGMEVPMNRITVEMNNLDTAVVGQYRGPRLEEGATSLPEGATIVWYALRVFDSVSAWEQANHSEESFKATF